MPGACVAVPRRRRLDGEAAVRLQERRTAPTPRPLASSSSAAGPRRPADRGPRARRGPRPHRSARAGGAPAHRSASGRAPQPDLDAVGTLTDDDCTMRRRPGRRVTSAKWSSSSPTTRRPRPCTTSSARLRDAGAADGDPLPKVVRALGPTATLPADVVSYTVGTPATVDAVIRHAISDAVAKLVANDPVVRIGEDPEGVHQARVATRRLRSHLRTFRELLDPEWTRALRDELGWLGDELGAVRDADVLLDAARGPRRGARARRPGRGRAAPAAGSSADREAARAVLLDGLRSDRYLAAARPARRCRATTARRHARRHRPRRDAARPRARAVEAPAQRRRRPAGPRARRRAARGPHPRETGPLPRSSPPG